MNISYEYYRIFYYAAKYRNLTLAAEMLHSSQPNISRTIRLMEEELGCRLLIRSNRGISLTPEGEKLYSHVRIAVGQLQRAEEELEMPVKRLCIFCSFPYLGNLRKPVRGWESGSAII